MLKEILDFVSTGFPNWALLALAVWDRLRRLGKYKQSDESREEALKQ